jgi:hypothetical protein
MIINRLVLDCYETIMNIIDLELYRSKRALRLIEQRMGELAAESRPGTVRDMKKCFRQWLVAVGHK